jgi:hypothetical protein
MPVVPYALTTLDRIKAYLGILDTERDVVLEMLINQATGVIERACGGRRFAITEYENELYDGGGDKIFLKQWPVTELTALEYRQGQIATPTWQAFNANDYILMPSEGYIQFLFGTKMGLSSPIANGAAYQGVQNIRISYTAGYLIDWDNVDDPTKHNLPFELEHLCMTMVATAFNRRKSGGISQESVEGASVTYGVVAGETEYEQQLINAFKRINV